MADSARIPLVANGEKAVDGARVQLPEQLPSLRPPEANGDQQQPHVNAGQQPMPQPDADSGQADPEKDPVTPPPAYSAFSPWRRRFILTVITIAGFFGPLAGGIYLPALPVLENEFGASSTAINITVSVFMLTFAFGVSSGSSHEVIYANRNLDC